MYVCIDRKKRICEEGGEIFEIQICHDKRVKTKTYNSRINYTLDMHITKQIIFCFSGTKRKDNGQIISKNDFLNDNFKFLLRCQRKYIIKD